MKERPVLFSAPMVRALLAGRKTQTRRIINPQPTRTLPNTKPLDGSDGSWDIHRPLGWRWQKNKSFHVYVADGAPYDFAESLAPHSPYGWPGDRLWVKETFSKDFIRDVYPFSGGCWYREEFASVDDPVLRPECHCQTPQPSDCLQCRAKHEGRAFKWRPSIFMPRALSRVTLEVRSIRAERLQSITEEDAKAEGVKPFTQDPEGDCWTNGKHATAFEYLWGEINGWTGAGSWLENPWVWVVGFAVLGAGEERRTA